MKDLILVVDESPAILAGFEKILKKEHFLISKSTQPETVLEIIKSRHPSVVILDMKMPGYSSSELLRQIKKYDRDLPVIIMTAYTNMFTEKDALNLGADAYLKKPFEIGTMLSKLRQLSYKGFRDVEYSELYHSTMDRVL
jgi:DNA-binding response OmpR family regulator